MAVEVWLRVEPGITPDPGRNILTIRPFLGTSGISQPTEQSESIDMRVLNKYTNVAYTVDLYKYISLR